MARRPLILSASRRTDLPAFYPERLLERLQRRVRGLRVYSLYGVVLWSKDPRPLLDARRGARLAPFLPNPALQLTITGLGGSRWEPHVPPAATLLARLPEIVAALLHGTGARLRWRFDPVWPRPELLDDFCRIADAVASVGGVTCTLSFPTPFCQRGSMAARYRALALPSPGLDERAALLGALWEEAAARGLRLLSCAQPESMGLCPPGRVEAAQCVPREVLKGLHPDGSPFPEARDPTQRRACRCLPSEDLGSYEDDPCGAGCVYCYSRAGGVEGRSAWVRRQATPLGPLYASLGGVSGEPSDP